MGNEGPYRVIDVVGGGSRIEGPTLLQAYFEYGEAAKEYCRDLNAAYAAGRASRDAEVKALVEAARGCIDSMVSCRAVGGMTAGANGQTDRTIESLRAALAPFTQPTAPAPEPWEFVIITKPEPTRETPRICDTCLHVNLCIHSQSKAQECLGHQWPPFNYRYWTPRTSR